GREAGDPRPPLRGLPRQRRARVDALPRQRGLEAPPAGQGVGSRARGRGVLPSPRPGTLAGRLPRARVPEARAPLSRDRRDPDALPRPPFLLLHRLLGQRLSVHHLRPEGREPARGGLRPGAHLEHARRRAAAAGDLGVEVPELLDAVRGVPEHPREPRPSRAAAAHATPGRRTGGVALALLHVPERAQGPLALGVDAARGGSGPPERDLEPAAVGAEALDPTRPLRHGGLLLGGEIVLLARIGREIVELDTARLGDPRPARRAEQRLARPPQLLGE